jgi:hypothetical protein
MAKPEFMVRETENIEYHGMVQEVTRAAKFKVNVVLVQVTPKFRAQMFVCNFIVI